MISYRLYLDDSGTHAAAERLFLAGTMMSCEEWDEIEIPWHGTLKGYNLKFFHATEVWGNCPGREKIFRDLGKLIFQRNLAVWWGAVHKTDFKKIRKEFPQIDVTEFEFLVFGLIGACHRAMQFLGGNGRIKVILEDGPHPIRQQARDRIKAYEKKTALFEHPWQTSPKGPVPLQVADYIAWHYNRFVQNKGQVDKLPFFEMITPSNKQRFWGANIDDELLRKKFAELAEVCPP